MATLPASGNSPQAVRNPATALEEPPASNALVPVEQGTLPSTAIDRDSPIARLPVELEVGVPIRDFRVRSLLSLEPGVVVESLWSGGEDLPVACGDELLAWSEFEIVDTLIAVRITRLP